MKICIFLLSLLFSQFSFAAKLEHIQIKQNAGKTSLFFKLDRAIVHKVFTLTNPDRVVVDLENTNLDFDLKKLHLNSKLIKLVRSGRPQPHTLRLVFEVATSVMLKQNLLRNPQGFSFDLASNPVDKLKRDLRTTKKPQPIKIPHKPLRDVIIVIDAGHGGKDPGAIGPHHSKEKFITLAIALKLKNLINKQQGMKAVLTRTGDYYVGLRERLTIARKYSADVFISVHADAFINQQSKGVSVFALSQRGATSEAARWLAEKENYSELGGVNLRGLDDQSGLVRTVLIDLSQTATISASLHMGERVLSNLNKITELHNPRVEQARFMVLKSPDIPSILIETGFISNPREERNLTTVSYQDKLTESIFQGVKKYFWEYAPQGTKIEAEVSSKIHIVHRGESLEKIAALYHTKMAVLQEANKMISTQVNIGQKIAIPSTWS